MSARSYFFRGANGTSIGVSNEIPERIHIEAVADGTHPAKNYSSSAIVPVHKIGSLCFPPKKE